MPTNYISYYRVSTDKQGISGLGLEAQKHAVTQFIGGSALLNEYVEIESGKSHRNRPQLTAAMAECRKRKATLVIAKMDRLSRNVAFISALMDSGVEFVAVDNPHANRLMLHMLAAFAEHEREMISVRTKAALAAAKARGTILGNPRLDEARRASANTNRNTVPPEVLKLIVETRQQSATLREVCSKLNGLGIRTSRGSIWYTASIQNELNRVAA
jgi:DNA invertase Pin-like site-specific DNA recombinase